MTRDGSLKRKETAMLIISPSHLPPSYFGCPTSIRRAVNTLEQHSELTYEAGLRLPVLDDSFNHNVQVQNKFMRVHKSEIQSYLQLEAHLPTRTSLRSPVSWPLMPYDSVWASVLLPASWLWTLKRTVKALRTWWLQVASHIQFAVHLFSTAGTNSCLRYDSCRRGEAFIVRWILFLFRWGNKHICIWS